AVGITDGLRGGRALQAPASASARPGPAPPALPRPPSSARTVRSAGSRPEPARRAGPPARRVVPLPVSPAAPYPDVPPPSSPQPDTPPTTLISGAHGPYTP